jgi:glycosyltransferase involved in cell wall biosynthesis
MQPLLSMEHFLTFIIPCYNCEEWIEEAVASIYEQKNLSCPFEIVCTDDGSTDGTYAKLCSLRTQYPELHLFRHLRNRGGGACRNSCVAMARGDLIFCLDADNVLAPNSVQALIEKHDQTGDDVVAFGMVRYFVQEHKVTGLCLFCAEQDRYTLKDVLQKTDSPPWSGNYLYTKESFLRAGGYPEHLGAVDTFAFGVLQLLSGSKMSYVPGTYYLHRHDINGYYLREGTNHRNYRNFCSFLLDHREILTAKTVNLLKKKLDLIRRGKLCGDQIMLLEGKKIQLKPAYRQSCIVLSERRSRQENL